VVRRAKNGLDSTQPLTGRELRALRPLQRKARTRFVFESERGTPMSVRAAQWIIEQDGLDADLPLPVHIHMLRHSCGYKLANDGQPTPASSPSRTSVNDPDSRSEFSRT
jgi:integrase